MICIPIRRNEDLTAVDLAHFGGNTVSGSFAFNCLRAGEAYDCSAPRSNARHEAGVVQPWMK